ncbi:VOC family protein [Spelaeicoccus albus]|uniref:Catechol 2,3-dioxygenase-like lactoylglutathione lyase family enzyme n=1 Tax=Spelaeicoccus albus TaxID=1280376 RepID=A0A7Z0D3K5_9MICO|nr:VOC family protein [Spelaeicoccus albus]NYI68237.1 catechol 2,3-dioxygenase-like lactoylglutathione lyase family enzyme [Spelaeicoccus albus]
MTTIFSIRMITIDCHDPSRLTAFWSQATGCPVVADYGDFVMVGSVPTLGFQRVPDPTPGKYRIHFDGGGADREVRVHQLCALGATEHETRSIPGLTWTVMTDPEGNYFCVGNPGTD